MSYRPATPPGGQRVRHRAGIYFVDNGAADRDVFPWLLEEWVEVLRFYRQLRRGLRVPRRDANLVTFGWAERHLRDGPRASIAFRALYDRERCDRCTWVETTAIGDTDPSWTLAEPCELHNPRI